MRRFQVLVALALAVALDAAPVERTLTIAPSQTNFNQARAACPKSLSAIAFVDGRLRVANADDVTLKREGDDPSKITLDFKTGKTGYTSARVTVDQTSRSVTGKDILTSGNSVICVNRA